jgi:DNA-directed RNA polymerase specialized sigma24 family protein
VPQFWSLSPLDQKFFFVQELEVIEAIRKGGRARQFVAVWLLEKTDWPVTVRKLVYQSGSSARVSAKDVFTDAYLIFEEKIASGTFEHRSNLRTFFLGIAKNVLRRYLRALSQSEHLVPLDDDLILADQNIFTLPEVTITELLALIPEKCRLVLLFDYYGYTQKEIADDLGYSSGSSAGNAVQKCKDALRDLIKKHLNQ